MARPSAVSGLLAFASRLRAPTLFALSLSVLVVDLLLPDALPFVDEILLGLLALALSRWRKSEPERRAPPG